MHLVIPSTFDILLKTVRKHCNSICWPHTGSNIDGLIATCYNDNSTKHQNRNYIIQCRPMVLNHLCITLFSEYDLWLGNSKYICKGPNKHYEQLIFCVNSKLMCKHDRRDYVTCIRRFPTSSQTSQDWPQVIWNNL
jgi:hypothetical protein